MPRLGLDKVAWVRLDARGQVLTVRNRGRDLFYFPGGRREGAETDAETLIREVAEELSVAVLAGSIRHFGTFELSELSTPDSGVARMACYFAEHRGSFAVANEIDEMRWMTYADRDRVSPLDQVVFDALLGAGHLL